MGPISFPPLSLPLCPCQPATPSLLEPQKLQGKVNGWPREHFLCPHPPCPLSWPVAGTLPPVTRPMHPKILATIFLSPCPPSSGIWMSLCHPVTHHPSPSIPATPAPNHRLSWPGLGPRLTKADAASPVLTSEADTKLMTRAGRKPHKPESQSLSDGTDTHLGAVTPGSSPGEGVGEPRTEGGARGPLQREVGSQKTPETGELGRYRN